MRSTGTVRAPWQGRNAAGIGRHEHAQLPGDDLREQSIGPQTVPHAVSEARQLDTVCAHDADPPEFQSFGKVENRATFEQRGKGVPWRQFRRSPRSVLATQADETFRPMMRSPASV